MSKKYKGVFRDDKGRIYCQTEFKVSATGKRQRFKRYRNMWGKSFTTEKIALAFSFFPMLLIVVGIVQYQFYAIKCSSRITKLFGVF